MAKATKKTIKISTALSDALCVICEVKNSDPKKTVEELVQDYVLQNLGVLTERKAVEKSSENR